MCSRLFLLTTNHPISLLYHYLIIKKNTEKQLHVTFSKALYWCSDRHSILKTPIKKRYLYSKGSLKNTNCVRDRNRSGYTDIGKAKAAFVECFGDIYSQFPLRLSLQRIASSNYRRGRRRPNMIL